MPLLAGFTFQEAPDARDADMMRDDILRASNIAKPGAIRKIERRFLFAAALR